MTFANIFKKKVVAVGRNHCDDKVIHKPSLSPNYIPFNIKSQGKSYAF